MGRGIARKTSFKKCSCDNPIWKRNWIEVNGNTHEIGYVLYCSNCKSIWKTKTHEARKFWNLDEVPIVFFDGCTYKGKLTNRQLFEQLDRERLKYLESEHDIAIKHFIEAKKTMEKSLKAMEKFKKQIEEFKTY